MSKAGLEAAIQVTRVNGFKLQISLDIAPGETIALLGPNGSGKTTAVAAIAGLVPLDEGHVTLDGQVFDDGDVFVQPSDRKVGVVFQDYLLFPHMTALENVAFGLTHQGLGRGPARSRAGEWLERVGLERASRLRPGELSGGQAQRVALARALAPEPRLLLLDEPLSALDIGTRARLRGLLQDHLADFAGPKILITHDPAEAYQLADEVHIIEEGRITQVGEPDDIRLHPATQYVADVAGTNLFWGTASGGKVVLNGHSVQIADDSLEGPVAVTIAPSAISVHLSQPEGSPRNTWRAIVERIEPLGHRSRLLVGPPLSLAVELTTAAVQALDLRIGSAVWLSLKATEVRVGPSTDPAKG